MMRQQDREALVHLYEDRFSKSGGDISTLGWKNRQEQELRFKILCEIGDLRGASICDVGCGFGDLLTYLRLTVGESMGKYTGLDIAPSLLRHAQELHPDTLFLKLNLAEEPFFEQHDYFLCSGALSFKVEDNMGLAERMIENMFGLARKGIAVNFLSSYVNYQHERNFHYVPEEIFRLARRVTRWVRMRHDYPLWEFTVYMFKEEQP